MVKHRLLVEKNRGNTCRKNQEKKNVPFFANFFYVSVFTALSVVGGNNILVVYMRLTCSTRITIYQYMDNANGLSAPSESYFA
jgi:hypothetical protein